MTLFFSPKHTAIPDGTFSPSGGPPTVLAALGLESEAHRAGRGPGSYLCDRSTCGRRAEHTPESNHTLDTRGTLCLSFLRCETSTKLPPGGVGSDTHGACLYPRASLDKHSLPTFPPGPGAPGWGGGAPCSPHVSSRTAFPLCFPLPSPRCQVQVQKSRAWALGSKGQLQGWPAVHPRSAVRSPGAQPSPYSCCSVFFTPSSPVLGEGALTSTISAGPAPSPVEVSRDEGLSV